MARVRTFEINNVWSVPDNAIANFITDCEISHYVNVTMQFVPWPTPRITVVVTKLDVKEGVEQDPQMEDEEVSRGRRPIINAPMIESTES